MRLALIPLAFLLVGAAARAQPVPQALDFFEKQVRPVLAKQCYACHSAQAAQVFGDLRLDSRAAVLMGGRSGPAVVPGDPEASLLIQAVRRGPGPVSMPPAGKLADREIESLVEWVRRGAPWPPAAAVAAEGAAGEQSEARAEHWAWRPLEKPPVPHVAAPGWARNPIDRFVLAALEEQGLAPLGPADRYTLLRRLAIDLTGLPPTLAQIEEFVKDSSPAALQSAVDRLLASPAFGELWGRHWLDLAGFADTLGLGRRIPSKHAWRYRDYVIEAFNRDKPYDQFVREQVAGDVLAFDTDAQRREQVIATGFLAIGPWALVDADKTQLRMDVIDDQLDTLGRAILGLTVGCARCHDHKFDPIPQREYYAFAGVFYGTQTLDARMSGVFSDVRRTLLPETPREIAARANALADWQAAYASAVADQQRAADHVDGLAAELREAEGAGAAPERLRELEEQVAVSRQEASKLKQAASQMWHYSKPEPPMALALADRPVPGNARIHIGGSPHSLGDEVPRGFLSLVPLDPHPKIANRRLIGFGFQKSSGRLELAQWLTDPGNPLPARVMANRVWHHLFGAGIVRSVDNFGLLGDRPTHPELLEHLAVRLQALDWSVKALVREIVLSRTYALAASHDARAAARDPENRLLWRANRRRLQAETIRDAVLLASGALDFRSGGPSLPLDTPGAVRMANPPFLVADLTVDEARRFRRTIYLPTLRKSQLPDLDVLNLFDFPDPNSVAGRRELTTVPTQALYLLNSPFLIEHSRLAARAALQHAGREEERIRRFLLLALGRPASDEDLRRATDFLRENATPLGREGAWARYCHAVFASSEFLFRS